MEEVYRMRGVITVIPEAWEFMPQSRNTPVKLAGEALVRKGAASENFMWLDSQDITGVDKRVLKQVGVWILGVQREINEVEHTLDQMAVPKKLKPPIEEVMQLRRGQFFVCFEDVMKRVYVLPRWMPKDVGYGIAMLPSTAAEQLLREAIAKYQPQHSRREEKNVDYRAAYEEAQEEIRQLKERLARLERDTPSNPTPAMPRAKLANQASSTSSSAEEVAMSLDVKRPVIDVTKRVYVIEASDDDQFGRISLLIAEGFFDSPKKIEHINKVFIERGWAAAVGRPSPKNLDMAKLAEYGFVRIVGTGSYQSVPGMKVNVKEVRTVA
jgi:hypothetical protein